MRDGIAAARQPPHDIAMTSSALETTEAFEHDLAERGEHR